MNNTPFLRRSASAWALAAVTLSLSSGVSFAQSGSTSTGGTTGTKQSQTGQQATPAGQTGGNAYGTTRGGSASLERTDRRFLEKAAEMGMEEVAIAQLAAQRATNSQLRSFAQQLAADHNRMNTELMTIARNKNVTMEQETFDTTDRAYRRLADLSGQQFDNRVSARLVEHHEEAIKLFEEAAKNAQDPEVRAFASKSVPPLRQHLQQAQSLQRSIESTAGTSGTGATSNQKTNTSGSTASGTSGTSTTTPQVGAGQGGVPPEGTGTPGSNRPSTSNTGADRR